MEHVTQVAIEVVPPHEAERLPGSQRCRVLRALHVGRQAHVQELCAKPRWGLEALVGRIWRGQRDAVPLLPLQVRRELGRQQAADADVCWLRHPRWQRVGEVVRSKHARRVLLQCPPRLGNLALAEVA
eukprot:2833901-Lingulodinium_polyedra.AAC.1